MEKEDFLLRLCGTEEEEAVASAPRLQYYNKVRTQGLGVQHLFINGW